VSNLLIVGSLNMDTVIDVKNMPKPGETILGKKYELCPGGKGANQAYAAGKLGAKVSMIGMLGKDDNGARLLKNLQSVGVNTKGIQTLDDTTSGTAFITVDEHGENSIIVISGANFELAKEHIDRHIDLIDQCDAVVAQLEIPLDVVTYLANVAKSKNKLFILDPAPATSELPEQLIRNVDIMKPNETELQILTGMQTQTEEQIVEAARSLIKRGVKTVVVTVGSKGAVLVTEQDFKVYPSRKVEAVDTTAAGDTFTAAFAMKLMDGSSCEEAIKFGNIVSSIVVTRKGAQNSIPSYEEAIKIYQEYYKL
jgi:ribokinase